VTKNRFETGIKRWWPPFAVGDDELVLTGTHILNA
jgi:hypothetical protein